MLKIAAAAIQGRNLDASGQVERLFFQQIKGEINNLKLYGGDLFYRALLREGGNSRIYGAGEF